MNNSIYSRVEIKDCCSKHISFLQYKEHESMLTSNKEKVVKVVNQ